MSMKPDAFRLFMTADAVGGVWSYALDLAASLAPFGVTTTLAVLGPDPSPDQQSAAEAVPGLTLDLTGLPLDWVSNDRENLAAAGRVLARRATESGADLVHLNAPALAAEAAFSLPMVVACHSCVATWWAAVRGGPLPADFAWRSALVGAGYAAADRLVAPSRTFAETTAALYQLPEPPVVIRNGRSRTAFEAPADLAGPFVFTAGRLWDEGKNIAALDRAAARLALPVLAAGPLDGPNGARVRLGAAIGLGRLSDRGIAAHLACRPIFASMALYEPFGLAALEAAQAGCALVLSDTAGFRELWDGAALFVPPDDTDALVAAIEGLAADPETRLRLGRAARDAASACSIEAMAAGMLVLYRGLLPSRPAGTEDIAA